jgi:hypothetical protein
MDHTKYAGHFCVNGLMPSTPRPRWMFYGSISKFGHSLSRCLHLDYRLATSFEHRVNDYCGVISWVSLGFSLQTFISTLLAWSLPLLVDWVQDDTNSTTHRHPFVWHLTIVRSFKMVSFNVRSVSCRPNIPSSEVLDLRYSMGPPSHLNGHGFGVVITYAILYIFDVVCVTWIA